MSVELRAATEADRSRCYELLAELGAATGSAHKPLENNVSDLLLDQKRGRIIVAEEDGVLLGMASVSYNLALRYATEYCQLEELIVSPSARGKNVGGLLVQRTIDDAKERGCVDYGLYLLESTEHNRPFYAKYGFEAIGSEMRQRLDVTD